jgi:hypothetical protein
MTNDEFTKQQYLALREEIRDSKARIFWLLILGIVLVLVSGFLSAEYPLGFTSAAVPLLLIALMLSYIAEQDNISRAGRYIREVVEPRTEDVPGWEHWLEGNKHLRDVDHCFVIGFSVLFLSFFALTTSLTLRQLDKRGLDWLLACAAVTYLLAAMLVGYAFWRHWRSSTQPDRPAGDTDASAPAS